MRGAAVPAGEHTLVYTYQPNSFRIGAVLSCAGGVLLLVLAWWTRREPSTPLVPSRSQEEPSPEAR
jgi:uncharacterized membrane protein YfhO